jgi:hypothetical protein
MHDDSENNPAVAGCKHNSDAKHTQHPVGMTPTAPSAHGSISINTPVAQSSAYSSTPSLFLQSGHHHLVLLGGISGRPTHSRWNHSFSHYVQPVSTARSKSQKTPTTKKRDDTHVRVLAHDHRTVAHVPTDAVSRLVRVDVLLGLVRCPCAIAAVLSVLARPPILSILAPRAAFLAWPP